MSKENEMQFFAAQQNRLTAATDIQSVFTEVSEEEAIAVVGAKTRTMIS